LEIVPDSEIVLDLEEERVVVVNVASVVVVEEATGTGVAEEATGTVVAVAVAGGVVVAEEDAEVLEAPRARRRA